MSLIPETVRHRTRWVFIRELRQHHWILKAVSGLWLGLHVMKQVFRFGSASLSLWSLAMSRLFHLAGSAGCTLVGRLLPERAARHATEGLVTCKVEPALRE